jgi:hypothetical protein
MACLSGCSNYGKQKQIIGTWETDSVYTFYNGFDMTLGKSDTWPVYSYGEDGIMLEIMRGQEEKKSFIYEFAGNDSLVIHPTTGGDDKYYEIIRLKRNKMVLKQDQKPVFPGGNQLRYEIRFFSKTGDPKEIDHRFS